MDQVTGAAAAASGEMKNQAANLAESAKGLASDAGEKLLQTAQQQKAAGADFVAGMAGAVRRAANEFDMDVPQAARYIRSAAEHGKRVGRIPPPRPQSDDGGCPVVCAPATHRFSWRHGARRLCGRSISQEFDRISHGFPVQQADRGNRTHR